METEQKRKFNVIVSRGNLVGVVSGIVLGIAATIAVQAGLEARRNAWRARVETDFERAFAIEQLKIDSEKDVAEQARQMALSEAFRKRLKTLGVTEEQIADIEAEAVSPPSSTKTASDSDDQPLRP